MYAIVDIAGQQFKVEKDQKVYVHRLDAEEGKKVNFDRVLLIDDNGKVNIGAPAISGAQVSATVLEHLKGDKVIVFKKKRRKGYQKKNGHRQSLTEIQINEIVRQAARKPLRLQRRKKLHQRQSQHQRQRPPPKQLRQKQRQQILRSMTVARVERARRRTKASQRYTLQ